MKNEFRLIVYDGDLTTQVLGYAEQLANAQGIHISEDKELRAYIEHNNDIVAVLYVTSDFRNCFSFDVVVAKSVQRKGLGVRLVDFAIQEYEYLKQTADALDYGELEYCVEVVSNAMRRLLEKKGFYVYDEDERLGAWMMRKDG